MYRIHQEQRYASSTSNRAAANNNNDCDGVEETFFDWYQDYSTLRQHIEPYLILAGRRLKSMTRSVKDIEILIPGCGNSSESDSTAFTKIAVCSCSCCVYRDLVRSLYFTQSLSWG